jgi:hypothetical protein
MYKKNLTQDLRSDRLSWFLTLRGPYRWPSSQSDHYLTQFLSLKLIVEEFNNTKAKLQLARAASNPYQNSMTGEL